MTLLLLEFAQELADRLDVDAGEDPLYPTTDLFQHWGLDSLHALQLLVAIEELAGAELRATDLPPAASLGDLYNVYLALINPASDQTQAVDEP